MVHVKASDSHAVCQADHGLFCLFFFIVQNIICLQFPVLRCSKYVGLVIKTLAGLQNIEVVAKAVRLQEVYTLVIVIYLVNAVRSNQMDVVKTVFVEFFAGDL